MCQTPHESPRRPCPRLPARGRWAWWTRRRRAVSRGKLPESGIEIGSTRQHRGAGQDHGCDSSLRRLPGQRDVRGSTIRGANVEHPLAARMSHLASRPPRRRRLRPGRRPCDVRWIPDGSTPHVAKAGPAIAWEVVSAPESRRCRDRGGGHAFPFLNKRPNSQNAPSADVNSGRRGCSTASVDGEVHESAIARVFCRS